MILWHREVLRKYRAVEAFNHGFVTRLPGAPGSRTLEHLVDLPSALGEIRRLLMPGGVLDVVIPCEGGVGHTFACRISPERLLRNRFRRGLLPIQRNENVSS